MKFWSSKCKLSKLHIFNQAFFTYINKRERERGLELVLQEAQHIRIPSFTPIKSSSNSIKDKMASLSG